MMNFFFPRKNEKNDLLSCVTSFKSIANQNVQFDLFRLNGQILAQVYGYTNVKVLRPQLHFGEKEGYILELYFVKSKTDNEENYRRFLLSEFYSHFKQFEGIEPKGAYFTFFPSDISDEYFSEYIEDLLRKIYGHNIHIYFKVHG